MLIHLLLLLVHATRGSGQQAGRVRRKVRGKTTIFCPACDRPSVADEVAVDQQSTGTSGWAGWERMSDLYVCGTCRREYNAEAFENDGSGIMQARTWDCPGCRSANLAISHRCANCGYQLI